MSIGTWRCIGTAIDYRARLGCSEIHTDDTGATAAGFRRRAAARYAMAGVACERILTDNGPCHCCGAFAQALNQARTSPRRTRPYRSHTNGKAERFNRIPNDERAYAADWDPDAQRTGAHQDFMRHYNEHRPHGALSCDTPMAALTRLTDDNVVGMHS